MVKSKFPPFLAQSPIPGKGLPLGNALSYMLGFIYLLDLDLKIKNPFLRYSDDYVIFAKSERELEILLKFQIIPYLKKLKLKINVFKLKIGKVPNDGLDFLGFCYKGDHFGIEKQKIEEFKKKIIRFTKRTDFDPKE